MTKCSKRCEFQNGVREVVIGSLPVETVSDVGIGRRVHQTLSRSCFPVPGHKRWDIHGHPRVRSPYRLRNMYHELKDGGCWRSFAFCERLLDGQETCPARPGRKGWRLAGVPGQGCLGRGACTPRVGFSGSQGSWDAGQEPPHPSARGPRGTVAGLGAGTGLSRCVGSGQAHRGPETPAVAEGYALGDESKNEADWGKGAGGDFLGSLPHPRPLQGPYGVTRPQGPH